MSLNRGVQMNGYKRVRRELGTVAYEIQRKPNVYEQFYEKEAEAVREFVKHTKPSSQQPKNEQPKTVEIKEKKNKMEDIMALINDPDAVNEDTEDTKATKATEDTKATKATEDTKEIEETKETEDTKETQSGNQVGVMMKTIRVTNVKADPKKNELIL